MLFVKIYVIFCQGKQKKVVFSHSAYMSRPEVPMVEVYEESGMNDALRLAELLEKYWNAKNAKVKKHYE